MEEQDPKQLTKPIVNYSPDSPGFSSPGESSVCALEARVTTDITPAPPSYGDKKRREYQPRYSSVEALYHMVDLLDSKNFSSRLADCRSSAFFVRHEDSGEVQVRSHHCGLRWCPMCAASRQAWISTETERWFKTVYDPRLVTLTLKHTDLPLMDQITLLYDYFRKFRRRKFFADHCRGGVWFFHIKKSGTDHRWHPHIHMLIDSDFLEHKRIKAEWLKITGNSHIVHVKAVTNPTNSVKHAARYSAEPCDLSTHTLADSVEVYYALAGKRICGSFGTAKSISFRPKPMPDKEKWKRIGSYDIVRELKDSDKFAKAIWKAYCLGKPVASDVSMFNRMVDQYNNYMRAPPKFNPQGRFNFAA